MKAGYISYFEGYCAAGKLIFNGNGSCSVEFDESKGVDPAELLDGCIGHLLKLAQDKNADVVRVAILSISKVW